MTQPLPPLTTAETVQQHALNGVIAALRAAQHCATDEADAATIRARIGGLVDDRTSELLDLYQRAAARQQGTPA